MSNAKPNPHLSIFRAKRIDRSCRNHGSCPYCRRSRTRNQVRREQAARAEVDTAVEDYTGEIEDGFTNYSMDRCYYQFPCVLVSVKKEE